MSDISPVDRSSPIRAINPALLSLSSTAATAVLPAQISDPEACDWLRDLPEPSQSHFYTSSAESPQSEIQSPHLDFTELYRTSYLKALPDATRSAAQSPRAPFTDEFSQNRAHSQPPEELPAADSPPRPRRPRHPYPPAQFKQLREPPSHPYARASGNRPSRSLAPTSAPTLGSSATVARYPGNEPNTLSKDSILPLNANGRSITNNTILPACRFRETSISIDIENQVTQIKAAVSTLQSFLSQAFNPPDDDPTREDVETARHTARQHNHTLTELHEFLTPLPVHAGSLHSDVPPPITGEELRRLDHAALNSLLDAYDIAFSPGMFLWEKKGLYLRFVGAGRGLMHRVLD
ncbi:hypothetical protein MMC18_004463 [Xylographa bjoerkii]|nr:hypothetical protein [Xylographa bjoerkii]